MLNILFLAANPLNTEPLMLAEEMRSIDSALRQTQFRDEIAVQSHWAVRIADLQELFQRHQPDVVHFSGHGSETNEIILQDEAGRGMTVPASALSNLFAIFSKKIRCVVLNACYSADQAVGIAEHIETVIGMPDVITDQAATRFTTAFYRAIGYGQDLQTAFRLGCNQLELDGIDERDRPQLLGRSDPATVKFDLGIPVPNNAKEGRLRMSETPWWEQGIVPGIETRQTNGDVIIATVGSGAKNVAVGKNINQVITEALGEPQPDDKVVIHDKMTELKNALTTLQGRVDTMVLQMADFQLTLLEGELIKTEGDQTPSANTITQVGDWLLDNLPDMAEIMIGLFATPAVGRVVGRAGEVAVDWLRKRFSFAKSSN